MGMAIGWITAERIMPTLKINQAVEKLAEVVEKMKPMALAEIYAELFPEKPATPVLSAVDLALHVRTRLEAEEIVDLWNVVFPADRNVWYDEQDEKIHYNEESLGYAEAE
jgi:hypothetical protein